MRCLRTARAIALAVCSLSSVAGALAATDEERSERARPPGYRCWYRGNIKTTPDAWHGTGWYWCGPRTHRGHPAEPEETPDASEHHETPHETERHEAPHETERHREAPRETERHRETPHETERQAHEHRAAERHSSERRSTATERRRAQPYRRREAPASTYPQYPYYYYYYQQYR